MTISEHLKQARELLANTGWTQGKFAKDANGLPVEEVDPQAVCYCSVGALLHIPLKQGDNWTEADRKRYAASKYIKKVIQTYSIIGWNDSPERTKEEVLATFDRAAELAAADGV